MVEEQARLYGSWRANTTADALALFENYPGLWWVAGGHAIEAFTKSPRPHSDLDVSIPRADVPVLRRHVAGQFDVWQADSGTLRPMVDDADTVTPTCSNLWLREHGDAPWEFDVLLAITSAATWTYERDRRVKLTLDDALWDLDGVRYLSPEVQLLHKAPGLRAKDQADFDACLPRLAPAQSGWLLSALGLAHPRHPWIVALRAHRGQIPRRVPTP
ncbi:Aminoglycoside-2''-adenylyltransferase OS=Tsukamurella paurometabola (strain ATCC 8368 / DSM/ CCUG 35730 / CIP 100753 / JCM 10117 / KCTC 9821 / NBRC 16120/ NCIMB 702349 / NCTC 13040) OX=521096 GN=Tpau_1736 PE=4 SV=1 [Tsukamurella paurometabola]|uniref:Aminoglycoside-2''-adenylyltransferase n=1 Tax=Tsukamurella paurometabola (strain ATCC 8368 / DSM 20162 / CCUG 35730 / CIP 100753 / JCM 10117 / KCTC 9821 / NBRC 16120 / NCIMB 702349 / NCTC 13040) TaxID=521096 RepID=D5UM74_TSUPD|nr:hypothetical protein [Tsukamurella paurometabola]ADG78354.1 conserved hypothetical protein [Tsukamurella paurometabola DSM 20162]SUP31322.1 Uncharacterised protein [Tsukamurella paurometabola]